MVEQREKLLHQHAKATYQWKTSEKSSEAPDILIFHLPGFLYKTFGGSWVLFNISPSPPKTYQAAGGQPDTPTQHHAPLKLKPSTQFQSIQDLGTTISHQTSTNTICLNLLQISSFQHCSYKRRAITIFQNLSNATKKPVQTPRSPLKVRMWTLIFTPSRTQRCSSPSGLPSCTKTERERRWSSTKHIHNQCTEKFLVSRRKHGRPWYNTIPPVCEKHSLKSSCSSSYEQNYLNQRWPFSLHFRDCKFRAWLHIRKGLHCGSPMLPHGSWCAAAGCMEQLPRNSPIFHFYIVFFFFASVSLIFKTNPSGNLNTTRFGVIQHLRQGTRYALASAREKKVLL